MNKVGEPERVLIIPGSKAFGDTVEAFPAFQLIKEHWPHVHLAAAYQSKTQERTLCLSPYVSERVSIYPGSVRQTREAWRGFEQNYRAMAGFDIILFLYKNRVCWLARLTARLRKAKVYHGHDYSYRNPRRNVYSDFPGRVVNQIVTADLLGLPLSHLRQPKISLSAEDRKFAEEFFSRKGLGRRSVVMINTMCSPVMHGWGIVRHAQVANALVDCGVDVLINAGKPDQVKEFQSVANQLKEGVFLVETPTPQSLVAIIEKCDLLIGEASGQSWIATLTETPVIILTGPGERNYHAQGRAGPVWWPHDSRCNFITRIDWCQINMGPQCHCLHYERPQLRLKKLLKLLRLWKPLKKTLQRLRLYEDTSGSKTDYPPCLAAIQVEEVVQAALNELHIRAQAVCAKEPERLPCKTVQL